MLFSAHVYLQAPVLVLILETNKVPGQGVWQLGSPAARPASSRVTNTAVAFCRPVRIRALMCAYFPGLPHVLLCNAELHVKAQHTVQRALI